MIDAWVITLASRPDRLTAFRARAAAAGVRAREFVATVPPAVPDGWGNSAAAYGCADSHARILEDGTGPIAVFEDDAALPMNLTALIDRAVDEMPADWEMCLLGARSVAADVRGVTGPVVTPIRHFACTHAYLVSAAGRPHLAACARGAHWHWDNFASKRMCARSRVFGYDPIVVDQDPALGSDIPDSWTTRQS